MRALNVYDTDIENIATLTYIEDWFSPSLAPDGFLRTFLYITWACNGMYRVQTNIVVREEEFVCLKIRLALVGEGGSNDHFLLVEFHCPLHSLEVSSG